MLTGSASLLASTDVNVYRRIANAAKSWSEKARREGNQEPEETHKNFLTVGKSENI